ncbi:MAG: DUF1501 domain-containing protein [Gemmataceae bacterium]|nr:DUF1501 domain-containing protein [Gemmataceae bacterium]
MLGSGRVGGGGPQDRRGPRGSAVAPPWASPRLRRASAHPTRPAAGAPKALPRTPEPVLNQIACRPAAAGGVRSTSHRPEPALPAVLALSLTLAPAAPPDAADLSGETGETLKLYGLQRGQTAGFGWQCPAARRLAERGVRFVELIDVGSSNNWDSHGDMADHARLAKNVDQPIAGLLADLHRRGLLDSTLVVWTTEFGRTPFNNSADNKGREHHPWAFSSWLAGAGVKAGMVYGETDEYGIKVAKDGVHVHDLHATILHLMGLDHTKLTYRHAGRDYRLTDVAGTAVKGLLS